MRGGSRVSEGGFRHTAGPPVRRWRRGHRSPRKRASDSQRRYCISAETLEGGLPGPEP